jgi:hypothetical protein
MRLMVAHGADEVLERHRRGITCAASGVNSATRERRAQGRRLAQGAGAGPDGNWALGGGWGGYMKRGIIMKIARRGQTSTGLDERNSTRLDEQFLQIDRPINTD